jgi:phage shock protein PspC (stress-responsive transcriptional regulator)
MALTDTLNKMRLSKSDRKVFGVCGGLAQATDTPSWIWRAGFCMLAFLWGFGLIAYLVLWNFMPPAAGKN